MGVLEIGGRFSVHLLDGYGNRNVRLQYCGQFFEAIPMSYTHLLIADYHKKLIRR